MVFAQQWNGEQRSVPGPNERAPGMVEARQGVEMDVRELHRLRRDGELPRGPFTLPHRCRHQHVNDLRLEVLCGSRLEDLPLGVVFVDDARVRPGELRRPRGDRAEHRLKVEGGADSLTDLTECP